MGVRIWKVKCEKLTWKERKRGEKLQGGGSPALCDVTLSRPPPNLERMFQNLHCFELGCVCMCACENSERAELVVAREI